MLLIRRFEEKAAELYTRGKIHGFLHLYIGEEPVAVGAVQALTGDDNIISTYREHGHALARGMPAALPAVRRRTSARKRAVCSPLPASPMRRNVIRGSFPAACSSAWRLPGRWPRSQAFC